MSASYITFDDWRTRYNIPASYSLSQIFPAALNISDINKYWVPLVLETYYLGVSQYTAGGTTFAINKYRATGKSLNNSLYTTGFRLANIIAFQYPEGYTYGEDIEGFEDGLLVMATDQTDGLPISYGLGFLKANVDFPWILWDVLEENIQGFSEILYNETIASKAIGGRSFFFFLVDPGIYTPTKAIWAEAETYDESVLYNEFTQLVADNITAMTPARYEAPGQQLTTPTGLYADNITSDSARVSWTAVENASGYKVEYRQAAGGGQTYPWVEAQD